MPFLSTFDGLFGRLDAWYFRYHCHVNRRSPAMFHRGWGNHAAIAEVNSQWCSQDLPAEIDMRWDTEWACMKGDLWMRSAHFATPRFQEFLPEASQQARLHFVSPSPGCSGPVVVLMPTSREVGVHGRIPMARQLAHLGIGSVLLESPYMGSRKPAAQHGSTLGHFSDFLMLSAVCIEEACAVLAWLARQDIGPLGVAGVSKGGYLAAVAGLRSPSQPRVVAFLPPHSGVAVLLDGLLGQLCDWDAMQRTSGSVTPVRRQVADVFDVTSLERLPAPSQPCILVGAEQDRYVPRYSYEIVQRHWRGCAQMRWLPGGHVSSIAERGHFTDAVAAILSAS